MVRCEFFEREEAPLKAPLPQPATLGSSSTSNSNGTARPGTPVSLGSSPLAGDFAQDENKNSPSALDELDASLAEILVKNYSTRPEDRLERSELEELVRLRERIGAGQWQLLQEQAKQAASSGRGAGGISLDINSGNNSSNNNVDNSTSSTSPHGTSIGKNRDARENGDSGQPEFGDFLVQGVTLLREKRVAESTALFIKALDRAPAKSIAQAQVLVGLGSALEAAGMVDRALDCYIDALKTYERSDDADCRESVSSAIAHVYADMRDHTMAAAWFDYQLESISSDLGNGQRRIDVTGARDRQMRLGHVSEALLSAARGRVASHLASNQSRTALVRSAAASVAKQEPEQQNYYRQLGESSQDSTGKPATSSQQSAQGAVGAAQRRESITSASLGRNKAGIELLWEPRGESGAPTYTSSSVSSSFIPERGQNASLAAARAPRRSLGSFSAMASRPLTSSSSSSASGGVPHYLAPTTASRASAAGASSFRDRDGDGGSSSSDSGRSFPVDTEAVRARNSQAAALHVRRSLEARRKRDQEMGIRAPKVQSASIKMTSLRDKGAASELNGTGGTWSPRGKLKSDTNGVAAANDLVVILQVISSFDDQVFSVALPGPLAATLNMTVREMRERVSFVTGIELHDFELVVANTRLSDSWKGYDIGLGAHTELELHLLPGVRPTKYASSPTSTHENNEYAATYPSQRQNRNSELGTLLPVPVLAMPKRKPPVPSPDSLSPNGGGGGGGGGGAQQVVAPQSPVSTLHSGEQAEIEALCASVQSKLEEQRRIAQHADELGAKARAMLLEKDIDDDGSCDDDDNEQDDENDSDNPADSSDLASYSSSLMERIVALETELAGCKSGADDKEAQLKIAQDKILDLSCQITRERRARKTIQATFVALKQDFEALSIEARSSFSNFNSILKQRMRSAQAAAAVAPHLLLVAQDEQDVAHFQKQQNGRNKTWQFGDSGAPLFKTSAMLELSAGIAAAMADASSPLTSATTQVCDNILEGIVETAFVINFGKPLFYKTEADFPNKSLMLALVEKLFQGMAPDLQSTKMRAIVTPLTRSDIPVDVLNPDHSARSNVTISTEESTRDIKVQNAVTVKFHNIQDFSRLFDMVSAQVKASMPAHVFTVLENEHTQRRMVFVQVYGGSETPSFSTSQGVTVLQTFLRSAGACRPGTQTVIFAPASEQTAPGVPLVLEQYFASLVIR